MVYKVNNSNWQEKWTDALRAAKLPFQHHRSGQPWYVNERRCPPRRCWNTVSNGGSWFVLLFMFINWIWAPEALLYRLATSTERLNIIHNYFKLIRRYNALFSNLFKLFCNIELYSNISQVFSIYNKSTRNSHEILSIYSELVSDYNKLVTLLNNHSRTTINVINSWELFYKSTRKRN